MDIYRAHAHSISQCLWSTCPVLATEFMPRSQGTSGNNPGWMVRARSSYSGCSGMSQITEE